MFIRFMREKHGLSTLCTWIVERIGLGDSYWFPLYARFLTYIPSIACLVHLGTVVFQKASLASKIGVYFCDMALERTYGHDLLLTQAKTNNNNNKKKCYTPLIFSTFQALSGAGNGDPQHRHNHFPIDRKKKGHRGQGMHELHNSLLGFQASVHERNASIYTNAPSLPLWKAT